MILSSYWYSWRSFATMIVCKCANSSYLSLCLFILRIILLSGMSIQGLLRLIRLPLLCSGLLLGFVCTMRTAEPPWSMSVNDFSCGLMMNWPCSACLETRNYAVSDVVDGQLSKWTSSFLAQECHPIVCRRCCSTRYRTIRVLYVIPYYRFVQFGARHLAHPEHDTAATATCNSMCW